jgi:hypothetical protein
MQTFFLYQSHKKNEKEEESERRGGRIKRGGTLYLDNPDEAELCSSPGFGRVCEVGLDPAITRSGGNFVQACVRRISVCKLTRTAMYPRKHCFASIE